MRPPGHSGKAKRGHLCFDASFETGKFNFKIKIIASYRKINCLKLFYVRLIEIL